MKNPQVFSDSQLTASTSYEQSTKKLKRSKTPCKGKGKGKVKSNKGSYFCGLCNAKYFEGEDWIQCDRCDKWYHRVCADIESSDTWEYLQNEEAEWICPICRN